MKFFLSLVLLHSFSLFASDFPDDVLNPKFFSMDSDSGIRGPSYSKIVEELKNLEMSYPNYAQIVTYGKSVAGKPLTLIKIAQKGADFSKQKAIYIGGSIHGDEYLNIEDRLPRWILEQTGSSGNITSFLRQGGVIYIAPILNPDGYDSRKRENRNAVDLNRDFTVKLAGVEGLKQPETSSLITFLKNDLAASSQKLAIAMDYHCCIGALLYPWSFSGPVLPQVEKEKHLQVVAIMQANMGEIIRGGTTPVILGYSAKGTSKDFYYEHFGALGFTYEGRRGMENKYFEEHASMWDGIIKTMLITPQQVSF